MSARAWAAFGAVSLLWGIPYLFIRVAVDDGLSPAFVAWSRVLLGAVILLAIAGRPGAFRALRGRGRWLLAFAICEIVVPFPLIAAGEQHVSSSLAAILIATVPLIVAVLALRFDRSQRATGLRLVGLIVGFAGVAALVGIDVAGSGDSLLGAAAILVSAVGYAIGPMILNRHLADVEPRVTMAATLAIATVLLTPAAALGWPAGTPSDAAIASLLVLGILCTAAAFVIMAALVLEIGPGRAVVITYINPVVAVALGVVVLDERPGVGAIAGLLLILAGSWLSTDGRLPAALSRRRGLGPPTAPTRRSP